MPSPKAKPAALKLVEGRAPGRDSGGRPVQQPPAFKRLPPQKPDDLSDDASELWDVMVAELSRLEIIREVDVGALRTCCESWARYREAVRLRQQHGITAETSQGRGVAPWIRVEEAASKDVRAWFAEFGLTPASESKLAKSDGDAGEHDNPFASGG